MSEELGEIDLIVKRRNTAPALETKTVEEYKALFGDANVEWIEEAE